MKHRIYFGILLLILAEFSFTLTWSCVKLNGDVIPFFQILFFRSIITTIIVGFMMIHQKVSFKPNNSRILLSRCLFGFLGMSLSFYAITQINIGNAVTLLHTSPIFVALFSPLLIREKTSKKLMFWILISFIGVIFIVKPDTSIFQNVSLLALFSGLFAGLAYISVRHLTRTDSVLTITFYFLLSVTIVTFPIMIQDFVIPTPLQLLILIGTGVFGAVAQLLLTYAYKCGPANILTPFNNSAVVFSFLFGWLFWNEVPDSLTIIGATIIILSAVFISRLANRNRIPKKLPRIGE